MAASASWGFIRRQGLVLYEEEAGADGSGSSGSVASSVTTSSSLSTVASPTPFCFVSFNIPELSFIQDPWRLPARWEIRDALATIAQQGGRVARLYTFSVYDPTVGDRPCHVHFDAATGATVLNEEYFLVVDRVLAEARALGVRLIVPFVDQWQWIGGIQSYARFRHGDADDLEARFWTDPVVRQDFLNVVRAVVTRVNTVTGLAYRDDATVMAWETGNELDCPSDWTREVAAFIKGLDPRHLVIDGRHGVDPAVLDDPNVDIVSKHYYPSGDERRFRDFLREDLAVCAGKRPFFVGEFGFAMLESTRDFLEEVATLGVNGEGVVGAMLWSLRFRSSAGGFYFHAEPWGANIFWAYHWPGFETGRRYDEQGMMDLMRLYGARAQGLAEPLPLPIPAPPTILGVTQLGAVTFRGSTGARSYELQRARDLSSGRWAVVRAGFHDAQAPEVGGVTDASLMRTPPSDYFYRLVAVNEAGRSRPSPILPLLLPHMGPDPSASDPEAAQKPASPLFFFRDAATGHLMQLGRADALPRIPAPPSHASAVADKGMTVRTVDESEGHWATRDLTALLGAPAVAPGTSVEPLGPWADGRVIYAGWDAKLYELDTTTGALVDLSAKFNNARVSGGPSVWPGQPWATFRHAGTNHLCTVAYDPETRQHRFRDLSHDARAPIVGGAGGGPLAVSRREVVWVGETQHVYRLSLDSLALIDHSAASRVRARGPLRRMDRCKIFYASAHDGRLVEESLQGGTETKWLVTDHSAKHGAPAVAADGFLEAAFQSGRVLYRGAEDLRLHELWYCGEGWRVARREDEDRVVGAEGR